jgi:hypothetical protein
MASDISTGGRLARRARPGTRRLTTETRRSFNTSEFYVYIVAAAAILIAGLATGDGAADRFVARDVWLYFAIVSAAYMISRGLAKSGSREPYWQGGDNERRDRDEPADRERDDDAAGRYSRAEPARTDPVSGRPPAP